jgi:protocatechuate 3,4-dioxygenase beta subunit
MPHINNNPDQDINISRRKTLGTLGAFSVLSATSLIGCGGGSSAKETAATASSSTSTSATSVASSSSAASSASGSCTVIPTETIGPYPLSTLLNSSSVLREVINEDKTGVPLTVKLKLVNANGLCTPVSGYVYIWHCDKDGNCRGVQYTDTNGVATFTTIYPGWYAGRITHIHFQVFLTAYSSTAKSTAISQMAFPASITTAVYNSALYSSKGQNTSVTSFTADNVFSDGVTYQLATVTGDVNEGYVAELEVGLAI